MSTFKDICYVQRVRDGLPPNYIPPPHHTPTPTLTFALVSSLKADT
jgi:hypothetical protein